MISFPGDIITHPKQINSATGSPGDPDLDICGTLILAWPVAPNIRCMGSSGFVSLLFIFILAKCLYWSMIALYFRFGSDNSMFFLLYALLNLFWISLAILIFLHHKFLIYWLLRTSSFLHFFVSFLISFNLSQSNNAADALELRAPVLSKARHIMLFTFTTTTGWITKLSVVIIIWIFLSYIDAWCFLWDIWHDLLLLHSDARCLFSV